MRKAISTAVCAILIIMAFGCSGKIDRKIKQLDSPYFKVRLNAATYLSYHDKNPETIIKLIGLLESDNDRLVFISAQILGEREDSTAVVSLGKLTSHPNPNIRDRAVQSLGMINAGPAGLYILAALSDTSAVVRFTAVKMIFVTEYAEGVENLRKLIRDPSADIRSEVIHTLYRLREHPDAGIRAEYFEPAISDKSELVRYVAVQALDHPYPDKAKAALLLMTAFEDKSKNVRAEAVKSIGKIRYAAAIPRFKQVHDYEEYVVQIAISEAIKSMTGEDFPAFRGGLRPGL
ncbi:HEAT repeat domain-containing protein [Candidatus Latescibacterota bacterium]